MSEILSLITDGILRYLLAASGAGALLTLLAWLVIKLVRIEAPVHRHMLWLCALVCAVTLPAIGLYGPRLNLEVLAPEDQKVEVTAPQARHEHDAPPAREVTVMSNAPAPISDETAPISYANPSRSFPTTRLLVGLWLVGIIFMLTRLLVGWLRIRRICLSADPASADGRLGNICRGRLRILLSSHVDGPVCLGILRPVILLPRGMYDNAPVQDLRMVLSHELAHVERRDCWTNLFQRVIEAIFFFHPLLWYASFQLTQQREQICDNYVIEKGAPVMDYTRLLSRIAEQGLEKASLQAVALFEGRLLRRVKFLLDPKRNTRTKASRRAASVCAIAVLMCLALVTVRLEARQSGPVDPEVKAQTEDVFGERPAGNCSISGKVISAETGEPVDHAKVYLFYVGTHGAMFIDVANDGTFVFEDIPTGPFTLRTTNTAGYQDAIYDPDGISGSYPQFSLEDGEHRSGLVLKVSRAYRISGRVLDENDQPLRDRTLSVLAWVELDEPTGNLNRYRIARQTRITSDGSYSLDGLDGRPVYVMAIDWKSQEKDEFYPPCYYPGTVARNEAQKVHFNEEKSVDGAVIHLKKKGRFILQGIVTDQTTGNAVPKALITVHLRDMLFDRLTTYTDERGRYRLDSLGEGEFLVHVDAEPSGFVRTRKPVKIVKATKTNQLNFTVRPGATISGEFLDENGDPIELGRPAYGLAYKYGYANPETMSWSGARNRYGAQGRAGDNTFNGGEGDYEEEYMDFLTPSTFIIEGMIPGKTMLRFHPKVEGQTVKKILYNGRNIMETGLETKPGQEIKDVTIVIGTP